MATLSHTRIAPLGAYRSSRRAGAVAAVALHVAAAAALLSYEPARTALLAAAPIMVDLITPPKPEPIVLPKVVPPVEVPKPKPVAKAVLPKPRPAEPPRLITAPSDAPSPIVTAPPPPPAPPAAPAGDAIASAPAGPVGPVSVTPPIFNADYLENPSPAYPPVSRKMREQGRVMLRVLVNPRGTADEVQVRTSSGVARLDEAAQETVKRWKFVPAKRGAEAVSAWVLIPISFTLEG